LSCQPKVLKIHVNLLNDLLIEFFIRGQSLFDVLVALVEIQEGVLGVEDCGDVREEQGIEEGETQDHEGIEHSLINGDCGEVSDGHMRDGVGCEIDGMDVEGGSVHRLTIVLLWQISWQGHRYIFQPGI
jgi:hypothetical protein